MICAPPRKPFNTMDAKDPIPSLVIGEPKTTTDPHVTAAPQEQQEQEQEQKTIEECSLKPYIKCIFFLPWFTWVTVTTVIASPILLCTAGGLCGRDRYGFPTYPSCLADIQCCEYMADCKCKKGNI